MNAVDDLLRADSAQFTERNDDFVKRIQQIRTARVEVGRRVLEYREQADRSASLQTRSLRSHLGTLRHESRLSEHRNGKFLGRLSGLVERIAEDVDEYESQGGGKLVYAKRKYWDYVSRVYPSWCEVCERSDRKRVEELENELTHLNIELGENKSLTERTKFQIKESIHQKKSELMSRRAQVIAESHRLARGVRESAADDSTEVVVVEGDAGGDANWDIDQGFKIRLPSSAGTVPEPSVVQLTGTEMTTPNPVTIISDTQGKAERIDDGNGKYEKKEEVLERTGSVKSMAGQFELAGERRSSGSSINSDKPLPSLPVHPSVPAPVSKYVRFEHESLDDGGGDLSSVEILAGSDDDQEGGELADSKGTERDEKEDEEDASFSLDVSSLSDG